MIQKEIDYSYTTYQQVAEKDHKFVTTYAQNYAESNKRYSEDFADSVAFYFIDKNFEKNYPNRANYIKELLEK